MPITPTPKQRYVDRVGGTVNYESKRLARGHTRAFGIVGGLHHGSCQSEECIDYCALLLGTNLHSFGYSMDWNTPRPD